jgi:outer membrane protein TolC
MAAERIDYTEARQWTDYLTLDPLRLVQNLLGGGDVQRNRLAIVELEVRLAELVSRREAVATALAQQVVERVLTYEQLGRQLELLEGQLQTQRQQVAVMEAAYRLGQGSTLNMLSLWQRTEELEAQRAEVEIQRARGVVELEQLVGVD